jgi:alpha-glucuronidase
MKTGMRKAKSAWLFLAAILLIGVSAQAENGYDAWLRYRPIGDAKLRDSYRGAFTHVVVENPAPVLNAAGEELQRGLSGLLDAAIPFADQVTQDGAVIVTSGNAPLAHKTLEAADADDLVDDGYVIRTGDVDGRQCTVIAARNDRGALYGAFALLRRVQLHQSVDELNVRDEPGIPMRIANHWDNLDGTIERGYAGPSIFRWDQLPQLDPRYEDYARLLASVGIHGLCPNNESGFRDANTQILTPEHLKKAAALAAPFRKYGISLYFAVGFNAPRVLGGLDTADPIDPRVRKWWADKAQEIHEHIPDFGGFVVKADSEGQPGPYDYGRNHADGANMLAEALKPHGGLVLWRTFVYHLEGGDRARMGYDIFHPLDGEFADNVVLYTMTFPIDFLTREPVAPVLGGMPDTNMMVEMQITQEYNGQDIHLCYLVPQWRSVLQFDTHAEGEGSAVQKVIDGSLFGQEHAGIAGVPNVGRDPTWLGHHLHMANFHGFGRLAWAPDRPAEEIAEEWTRMTFSHDPLVVETVVDMLLRSHEIYESYTAPMGLGVLHEHSQHLDPAPHYRHFYHQADSQGVGFDRTAATGSGFVDQYHPPVSRQYEKVETTPTQLLLFFHHLPYTHRLDNGRTLVQYLYDLYFDGVEQARQMRDKWRALEGRIDPERYEHVLNKLDQQVEHAAKWRDTMTLFFFQLSGIPDEHNRIRSEYRLRHQGELP